MPPHQIKVLSPTAYRMEIALDREIIVNQLAHGPLTITELAELVDNNETYTANVLMAPLKVRARRRVWPYVKIHCGKYYLGEPPTNVESSYDAGLLKLMRHMRDHGAIDLAGIARLYDVESYTAEKILRKAYAARWLCKKGHRSATIYHFGDRARILSEKVRRGSGSEGQVMRALVAIGAPATVERIGHVVGGRIGAHTSLLVNCLTRIEAITGRCREVDGKWVAIQSDH